MSGKHIDIVFDGPPGALSGSFVDVEDCNGRSINFGEWVEREDGYWVLRLGPEYAAAPAMLDVLESLEWGPMPGSLVSECPWCLSMNSSGHAKGCGVRAALAQARGEEVEP